MRTSEEIVKKINSNTGLFNFGMEVMVPYLPFEHAKQYLKEGVTEAEWTPSPLKEEFILQEAKTYMEEYGWPKCLGHRGLSAGRTIDKMEAWFWLLGRDDVLVAIESAGYAQYGAPKLAAICNVMGWAIPDSQDALNMMQGKPCGANYECGCGS